ncbi:MAG: ABC transporter permease subunit, partial [Nitriliruptorales bacterium]|nr:ABC transporter permease subunit [Nitriliruptorales bacterium]
MASPTDATPQPAPGPGAVGSGGLTPGRPARTLRGVSAAPWGLRITGAAVAAIFALPLAWLLLRTVQRGGPALFGGAGTGWRPLVNSVVLASSVAVATTVVGTAAAWLTVRADVFGARLWRVLLPLPLVVPSFIGAFTLLAAFAPGGLLDQALPDAVGLPRLGGFGGAFAVLTLLTYPYVYLPVSARLRDLPASLEEQARLLNRGGAATFWRIVLPQARSAVAAGALLVFLYVVSDFGAVQLMRYDTLTRVIYARRLDQVTSVALSLQLGLLAVAVVAAERMLLRRRAGSSGGGRRG